MASNVKSRLVHHVLWLVGAFGMLGLHFLYMQRWAAAAIRILISGLLLQIVPWYAIGSVWFIHDILGVGQRVVDLFSTLITGRADLHKMGSWELSEKGKETMDALDDLSEEAHKSAREEGYSDAFEKYEKEFGIKFKR